jgi:hypothetical protein
MLIACGTLISAPVNAADPVIIDEASVTEPPPSGWTFAVDPLYTWLPGMNGNIRVFGTDISIDITAGDILSNLKEFIQALDGLYMGSGEARNGNFGLQYDIVYLGLGGTTEFAAGHITGGVDIGFTLSMTTLAANYRVYETQNAYLDAIAGARITHVDTDLTITLGPLGRSATDGDTWVDPVIGLKGRYDLDENWYFKGSALYGGFGVSSSSLYDATAFVGYEWANGVELYGGWRIADTKYNNGSFKWDMQLSGPMMGLTFKF